MYFCGLFVKRSQVIGLGILFKDTHPDPLQKQTFYPVRYRFTLYLKTYCVEVVSDWFDMKGDSKDVEAAEKGMESFKHEYNGAVNSLGLWKSFSFF